MSSSEILKVDALTFSYPGRPLFDSWSNSFSAGLTWVRGGNGSGKSTLLKIFAGVLPPAHGTCAIDGVSARRSPLAYRRNIFWCGPGSIPFDHLRAHEYFGFMRTLYPTYDASDWPAHLEGMNLAQHLPLSLGQMSTGTQRKIWMAAAFMVGTRVVLLDEPMNALDDGSLSYVQSLLRKAARQDSRAWIVASHTPWDEERPTDEITLRPHQLSESN